MTKISLIKNKTTSTMILGLAIAFMTIFITNKFMLIQQPLDIYITLIARWGILFSISIIVVFTMLKHSKHKIKNTFYLSLGNIFIFIFCMFLMSCFIVVDMIILQNIL